MVEKDFMNGPTVFTIGHSNHEPDEFLRLLMEHEIELVVDVRSSPHSQYNPQYNKENLEALLAENGIDYAFHGNSLGGRPDDPTCYDEKEINYAKVREKEWFDKGISYVLWEATNRVVTLLCAEEDPYRCHRHMLVTQELLDRDAGVIHIRGNGAEEEAAKDQEQLRMF